MAYEWRKGQLYYYRKERKNGKVVSIYCGPANSEYARLWMSIDQLSRRRRKFGRDVRAAERAEFADFDRQLDDLARHLNELVAAELEAAGYHQHKRQWRKRCEQRTNNT